MPKVIKKKAVKQAETNDAKALMEKMQEIGAARRKQIMAITAAAVGVVIIGVALFAFARSAKNTASAYEYEGYRAFAGLNEKTPPPQNVRAGRAMESFMKAHATRPTPYSLMYVANSRFELGKFDEALAAYEELMSKFPSADIYLPLASHKAAVCAMMLGKNEIAMKYFDQILSYPTPSFKDVALVESAKLLERMGKPEEAKLKYEKILAEFPASPFADEAKIKTGKATIAPQGEQQGNSDNKAKGSKTPSRK